jgi:hypothetical protein
VVRDLSPLDPAAEAASHQGEGMEAALVGPSTLASAYRAIIDFTPRVVDDRVAAVGIWLEGEEPSDPRGARGRKKGTKAPRRQSGTARLEDMVTRRTKAVIPKPPDALLTSLTLRPLEQEGVWSPGAIASRAEAHR